jgi:prenyltransferase beta subunit
VYWGLTATRLLGHPQTLDRDEMIRYVQSCQTERGSFSMEIDILFEGALVRVKDMMHI